GQAATPERSNAVLPRFGVSNIPTRCVHHSSALCPPFGHDVRQPRYPNGARTAVKPLFVVDVCRRYSISACPNVAEGETSSSRPRPIPGTGASNQVAAPG